MTNALIKFCLENKLVVMLMTAALLACGYAFAPFDWRSDALPRSPVPVDAIPDIGENQQIVFTEWMGRSPQDVEDQITYPLTSALLGLPKVKTVRSYSMFGFSSIYIIFEEDAEFYWTRSRILEKLSSLSEGTLPQGVSPQLGPDATALGQVFWYTIEGRDAQGQPAGGWDPQELRSVQDWYVRYALQGVEGVSEVASIGGFVKEYQIDVDPDALRVHNISLQAVFEAVRSSNLDVGARTIEVNKVEYVIRGVGFIKSLDDLRRTVITQSGNVPITLDQVAEIEFGPALRRGALDKAGAEAVGGVVVTRFGENPLAVIQRVKDRIGQIAPGLPSKTLEDGTLSQLTIVPFYDRSGLIFETLGTLEGAVRQQILVTVIVVIVMLFSIRSAALISSVLPLAVLFAFVCMKLFKVDANIVALSGIAIAIGTIVDMGIVLIENITRRLNEADPETPRIETIRVASAEVGSAIVTAVSTTIVSFLPVFTMQAAEGKLFTPLAFTKTFALVGSILVALTLIPPLAHWFLRRERATSKLRRRIRFVAIALLLVFVGNILAQDWRPFGPASPVGNFAFAAIAIGGFLAVAFGMIRFYPIALAWILGRKWIVLVLSVSVIAFGISIWIGFDRTFSWAPEPLRKTPAWSAVSHAVPGLGREFMPNLDEGSFLFMPTTMPHASIGEAMDTLSQQDRAIRAIPEIESVVGKIGRVDSALDPAPVSMIETIITYKSEYKSDADGRPLLYRFDRDSETFPRDAAGELIPDDSGKPFRQWRDSIRSPDDIWAEIARAAAVPGTTSAPKLQPIAARIVMLQSGVRAPMAYKIQGPDLDTLERVALDLEALLKQVPAIKPETVFADRIIGKPYLEIAIDREAIARYGIRIAAVQDVIEIAIGGKPITQTVEGRERYPVRVRYQRELRDSIEAIENILVAAPDGTQIPLKELSKIEYTRGPQMIKSEDTFLVAYVIFDKQPGYSEVEVVEQANAFLRDQLASGAWSLPTGVAMPKAIGNYENELRATKRLQVAIPAALFAIFLILYFQFRKISATLIVANGVLFALSGGMILLWLYGQPWFMNVSVMGENLRGLFQMDTINLSVAVWVGFLALFGIATDDGVLMATYLEQRFKESRPESLAELRSAVVEAANRRIRPAMMTSATTILALLPVLTSSGRGSDIMVPMAIPTFGGMALALATVFIVPVLYCWLAERSLNRRQRLDRNA